MRKTTKQERSDHDEACELLATSRDLTDAEVEFVLEHWHPLANGNNVSVNGTFFTPLPLCRDVAQLAASNSHGPRYLDLCAGIGGLTWALYKMNRWDSTPSEYTCIEINPEFVAVGRRLMPWAKWICGNIFDEDLTDIFNTFDMGVSNPPFGKVASTEASGMRYVGKGDLMACEVLARLCRQAFAIMPQMSLPWDKHGNRLELATSDYRKWQAANMNGWELNRTSISAGLYEFVGAKGVQFDIAELCAVEAH